MFRVEHTITSPSDEGDIAAEEDEECVGQHLVGHRDETSFVAGRKVLDFLSDHDGKMYK